MKSKGENKIKSIKNNSKKEIKLKSIKNENESVISSENIILGPSIVIDSIDKNELCIEIIKSGTKKGSQCSCKKFNDNLCKRHIKLKNKIKE